MSDLVPTATSSAARSVPSSRRTRKVRLGSIGVSASPVATWWFVRK
jgi:hypothetical protein